MSVAFAMESDSVMLLPPNLQFTGCSTDPETIQALETTFRLLDQVDQYTEENGIRALSLNDALPLMTELARPDMVIVDIDDCIDTAVTIKTLAENFEPSTRIIAVGSENDVQLYRDLLATGIEDYLIKPVSPDTLIAVYRNPIQKATPQNSADLKLKPQISLVIGSRGGLGTSSLAINLAWALSHQRKLSTSLLDLDLTFGVSALAFDLEASTGLREALASPDRLDSLLMESAIIHESQNLKLLGAEDELTIDPTINPQALVSLFRELRLISQHIIVDMPKYLLSSHDEAISHVDNVFLLTDQTLSGLRDTVRIFRFLQKTAPEVEIHLVLSDGITAAPVQFSEDQFEQSLGQKIAFMYSADAEGAAQASNIGKPIVAARSNSPVVEDIEEMVQLLCGEEEEEIAGFSFLDKVKGMIGR